MDFYSVTLGLHNFSRWLVLVAAVVALLLAVQGLRGRPHDALDRMAGMAFVHSLSLQLVLGVILLFSSPLMQSIWANFGAAMQASETRFFAAEHWVGMLLALALGHIGSARIRKAPAALKHRQTLIFFGLSLLLVLLAIPWWRPLLRL